MNKELTQEEIHENFRKELWCKIYFAYVSASNSTTARGGASWADTALEEFDNRFGKEAKP